MFKLTETLRWLKNSPPTNITSKVPDGTRCDYCERTDYLVNFQGVGCICQHCLKRIADKILKEPSNAGAKP